MFWLPMYFHIESLSRAKIIYSCESIAATVFVTFSSFTEQECSSSLAGPEKLWWCSPTKVFNTTIFSYFNNNNSTIRNLVELKLCQLCVIFFSKMTKILENWSYNFVAFRRKLLNLTVVICAIILSAKMIGIACNCKFISIFSILRIHLVS